MAQGSRPDRVADQIRGEVASMLARDVQGELLGHEADIDTTGRQVDHCIVVIARTVADPQQ